jgi:hypothetical protein
MGALTTLLAAVASTSTSTTAVTAASTVAASTRSAATGTVRGFVDANPASVEPVEISARTSQDVPPFGDRIGADCSAHMS